MSHKIADIVVIVDILHNNLWLLLLLFHFNIESLSWGFQCLEGVFEVPGVLCLWPSAYTAVRQDPVGLLVAHECCSGDDDCDYNHETNGASKHTYDLQRLCSILH